MGLAVVRRIMEASGGRVLIEKGEPGGARVALEFQRPAQAGPRER
jgi:nitrogen fixation/metabolism regulation signal transduction histidine kinase